MHNEDLILNAEREVVDRLFKTEMLEENKYSKKEREVRMLSASLFLRFFDAEKRDEVLFGPRWNDPVILPEYLNKAEKVFTVAGNYENACNIIKFLSFIDHDLAKQVVEKL